MKNNLDFLHLELIFPVVNVFRVNVSTLLPKYPNFTLENDEIPFVQDTVGKAGKSILKQL
jgi:hypothetical protein